MQQRRLTRNEEMPENTGGDEKLHWLAEEPGKEKQGKLRMAKGNHHE